MVLHLQYFCPLLYATENFFQRKVCGPVQNTLICGPPFRPQINERAWDIGTGQAVCSILYSRKPPAGPVLQACRVQGSDIHAIAESTSAGIHIA
jgi:hypothetical protein